MRKDYAIKYICKFGLYCHKYILELDITFFFLKKTEPFYILACQKCGWFLTVGLNK